MVALEPGMLGAPNVRLEKKLAEGGMGSVWVAEHLTLKTRVAVKFVLAELGSSADVLERFEREAQAVATIKSPHLAGVLDYGINELGHPYIVMELLEGEDLASRMEREKQIALPVVAEIVSQTAKAVGKAHQLGIVHRDLKPENLFLIDVDGDVFVKVLDFGIAKRVAEKSKRMTQTGSMLGTPIYMSPEQMTNAKAVGPGSDVWALGVVAYHALTGEVPFDGETMAALAIAVDRGVYEPVTARVATLPPAIDAWMAKALQKDPADRFASVREMADRLLEIARDPTASGEVPRAPLSSVASHPNLEVSSQPESRTMYGTASEAKPRPGPRVWGFAALALVLVAVAVAGIYFMRPPVDRASANQPSGVVSPIAAPVLTGSSATSVVSQPVVSVAPQSSTTAAASAVSSGAPDGSAAASPSASAAKPAASAHKVTPGHGAKPQEGIPTTF
jgi:serine/threonine-protein kinase